MAPARKKLVVIWLAPATAMVGVAEAMVTLVLAVALAVAWGWPSVYSLTGTGLTEVARAVAGYELASWFLMIQIQ